MPELAEVEYYRHQWDQGLNTTIFSVEIHPEKRVFKGLDTTQLMNSLPGKKLISSQARGKQMIFRFSGNIWLGIHLGMTGQLSVTEPSAAAGKHDHLVLRQERQSLLFADPRCFGRIRFDQGAEAPPWWQSLPMEVLDRRFTIPVMAAFLQRHAALTVKGSLLLQTGFPGVGNWMADEILWRAGIHPRTLCQSIQPEEARRLWKSLRYVCQKAMKSIGKGQGEPPRTWLFHERWTPQGACPKHRILLRRETIAGRTTAWCEHCQT